MPRAWPAGPAGFDGTTRATAAVARLQMRDDAAGEGTVFLMMEKSA
jgi:hypothetical protein